MGLLTAKLVADLNQLSGDADGDFLRVIGADVEADGAVEGALEIRR